MPVARGQYIIQYMRETGNAKNSLAAIDHACAVMSSEVPKMAPILLILLEYFHEDKSLLIMQYVSRVIT